jgi:malonyl CoA-acyl carrier protein transacylase
MMPFSADSVRPELIIISASDEDALVAEMNRLIAFIDRLRDVSLVDIAYTCSLSKGNAVISIIATSVQDLRSRLSSAVSRISSGQVKRLKDKSGTYYFREHLLGGENGGKLAFVYPGVMSYYPDMMRDMAIIFPECRAAFDELEEALSGDKNFTPSNFIFPPAPYYKHDADIFSAGAYAQALVSVFAASVAMTRLFSRFGLSPNGIVGCAGGDLSAVMASGAAGDDVSRPDRVRFIRDIYKIVDKAVNHAGLPETPMITVLPRQAGDVEQVLVAFNPKDVILALDFSPRLKTYAVRKECVDDFVRALTTAGIRSLNLALDRPFNTALCSSMVPAVRKFVGIWVKHKPSCEVFSCATAQSLSPKPRKARDDTAERWSKPVRFTDTILAMHEAGYKVFLEVGPRGLMTSAIEETLKGKSFAAIATNSIHRRGILQALHAIAQLAALGAPISVSSVFARRQAKKLDFDAAISMEVRRFSEMRLSRLFPKMTLTGGERKVMEADFTPGVQARGAKAAMRAAALAERNRRVRQFDFGVVYPMLSDADEISSSPGISCELSKTFTLEETPFIGDFSYGSSQLSYSDPNLRGLVMLAIPVAVEIMAEAAVRVMPKRHLAAIEDFICRRQVKFEKGRLALTVHAERTAAADPRGIAVKVQLRNDMPNAEYTWPIMEATFILAEEPPHSSPQQVDGLSRPRSVHWSGRDIYPSKLGFGPRLRGIVFAELWGEGGLDYEVAVPKNANCVSHTHFPIWAVNPLLMQVIVSGFTLWRRHERFTGAFSYPCRFRRMELKAALPTENSKLNCYLRLTGVTPRSHLCDITVTSGDGNEVIKISGWEEITDRVPQRYCEMILQPATSFIRRVCRPRRWEIPLQMYRAHL